MTSSTRLFVECFRFFMCKDEGHYMVNIFFLFESLLEKKDPFKDSQQDSNFSRSRSNWNINSYMILSGWNDSTVEEITLFTACNLLTWMFRSGWPQMISPKTTCSSFLQIAWILSFSFIEIWKTNLPPLGISGGISAQQCNPLRSRSCNLFHGSVS